VRGQARQPVRVELLEQLLGVGIRRGRRLSVSGCSSLLVVEVLRALHVRLRPRSRARRAQTPGVRALRFGDA
jgi:hypothetical protein